MPLTLTWNNTVILANANVLAVRAYWRVKTVGGAFNTTGFTPANDLAKSIVTTDFNVIGANINKVLEFKTAAICSTGGPTDNSNGIVEGIVFQCIVPHLIPTSAKVDVSIDTSGTDITKGRLTLKKQSDNSIVGGPVIVNVVSNSIDHSFTGLDANTGYYIEVELYATVNGVEVKSSDSNYLNSVCGGNTTGYQTSTLSDEVEGEIRNFSSGCDGSGRIIGISFNLAPVNMITGTLPLIAGGNASGSFPAGTHTLIVTTDGLADSVRVVDSMGNIYCTPYSGAGDYSFPGFIINSTNGWKVELNCGACPP